MVDVLPLKSLFIYLFISIFLDNCLCSLWNIKSLHCRQKVLKLNLFLKFSYLNLISALTLASLIRASNNPAQVVFQTHWYCSYCPKLQPNSPFSLHPTPVFERLSQDLDTMQLSHLLFLPLVHPLELSYL